ncbi:MAG: cobalamin B12-binding domain-containing protein [Ignavibacteriales bacterium]|nr:cobalamin B12-binding domain-containing protein [Ignavibacteriales bacterium]
MKILLVQPAKSPKTIGGEDVFIYEPLALEYLASAIEGDHEVKILDLRLENNFHAALDAFNPDIVGITAYTVHVNVVKALFDKVKRWNSKILTIVGGHHATVIPEDFCTPSIDVIVMGEGVFALREIVRRHEKRESLIGIAGTIVAEKGVLHKTDASLDIDLDTIPFPNRNLTEKYRAHYYSEWMKPLASIRTSKGCPFRCNFCAEWKVAGGRYYKRAPQQIVDELATIAEPYVFFADDESLVDVARMTLLAQMIKAAGIQKRYFLYGRADTIARNRHLLEVWREIGLERIFIGLEFFRDEDLKYIRKSSTVDDSIKAIQILRDLDIQVYASFIVRPEFSRSDFTAYQEYCRSLKLNYATFTLLTPLPGTDLFEETKDRLLTHEYEYFDFIHTLLPTTLPLKEFYSELSRLYQRSIPVSGQLSLLKKYRMKEIPKLLKSGRMFYKRLSTLHLDYVP